MNTKASKRTFRLHMLMGLICLVGGLAGCGGSSNDGTLNTAVETDSSEATAEKRTNLHFGIFSNGIDVKSAQSDRGQFKSSSEFGDITLQNDSSNNAESFTVASSSRSDSCLNIGEGQSSCSSSSINPDGSSSSNASAEATGDSTVTETNASEDGSSSSSSSSSNHNADASSPRSSQVTTKGSILVERPGEANGDSAEALQLAPVGNVGLYFGQVIPDDKQVESSNSNTSKKVKEYFSGFILATEKSTQISAGSLSGNYGFIGIESSLGEDIRFLGVVGEKSISDDMLSTETRSNQISILRSAGGQITAAEDISLHDAISFSLDPTGSIMDVDEKVRGFVNQNAAAFVYFGQTPTYHHSDLGDGSGLSIALQLPTSAPNLAGQTYRLRSMTTGLNDQGLRLGAITSGEMHFNADNTTVSLKDLVVQKSLLPFAGGDVDLLTSTTSYLNLPLVLEENGRLNIAGIATEEGTLELEGYVSANGEMIIMLSTLTNEAQNIIEIGMVVGIKN